MSAEAKAYRSIPVDVLREFYTDQVELSSLMQVAARAGLGRSTLQSFLTGSNPQPRTRRALGLYYLHVHDAGPYLDALAVLAGDDHDLERALVRLIVEHHEQKERNVPTWLRQLERGT